MPMDYDRLMDWRYDDLVQAYTVWDSIRYALSIGLGGDTVDSRQLPFVLERDTRAFPTQAVVLATPGFWPMDPATAIDWVNVLHGEESLVCHKPLPAQGRVSARQRVTGIVDKGRTRGAIMRTVRDLSDETTKEPLATISTTWVCRGDGGCGGPGAATKLAPLAPDAVPGRASDAVRDLATRPQAALFYRLTGDVNPLHADPEVARGAGFERPILHGLCTLGHAVHAVLDACADFDSDRFKGFRVRFTAPVFPGETLRTEMWRKKDGAAFRTWSVERDAIVLDHGHVGLAP